MRINDYLKHKVNSHSISLLNLNFIERSYLSERNKDSIHSKWQKAIILIALFAGFITSLIISWIYTTQRSDKNHFNHTVLGDDSDFGQFIENFFPLFLNFMSALPINFVMVSKIVLFMYSRFIEWDVHAHTQKDVPTYVNDPKKIETLGYVEHLFTSKNGIMTDNNLQFKMCSINDLIYGTEDSGDKRSTHEKVDGFNFKDHRLYDDIIESGVNGVQAQDLFKALA